MTLKEAKKILKKEFLEIGFKKYDKPLKFEEKLWIRNEKPEVLEALHIMAKNGISVFVPETALRIRSIIIKKMRAGEGAPAPVSDTPLSAAEGIKLQWKDNKNTDKNPALAEAASQFNDALLDEQGKKIKRFGKEIARLNKVIHKKNLKIEELRKESCRHLNGKIKEFGENVDLEQKLKDKDAVLSDVAEELRLSKIREKNLVEVSQKYMNKNKELNKELEEANNLVKEVRKVSKEYCEYGIAAEKMIQKLAKIIVSKGLVPSDVFEKCRLWANGYRFNPQLPELSEDGNGIFYHIAGVDVAEEGADHTGVMVLCGKDFAKILKEDGEAAEELSKVLNDVIDRFLLFGEIIIKEE